MRHSFRVQKAEWSDEGEGYGFGKEPLQYCGCAMRAIPTFHVIFLT